MKKDTRAFSREWWSSWEGVIAAVSLLVGVAALIVALVVAFPRTPKQPGTDLIHTPTLGISFWQHGKLAPMTDTTYHTGDLTARTVVTLRPDSFELHFPTPETDAKDNGLAINAWTDDSQFSLQDGLDTDGETDASFNSPFHFGKALANYKHSDAILYLERDAFSYFDKGRADPAANDTLSAYFSRVNLPVQTTYTTMPTDVYTPSSASLHPLTTWSKDIYLTVWQDENSNGVVNSDEYEYITLHFQE